MLVATNGSPVVDRPAASKHKMTNDVCRLEDCRITRECRVATISFKILIAAQGTSNPYSYSQPLLRNSISTSRLLWASVATLHCHLALGAWGHVAQTFLMNATLDCLDLRSFDTSMWAPLFVNTVCTHLNVLASRVCVFFGLRWRG